MQNTLMLFLSVYFEKLMNVLNWKKKCMHSLTKLAAEWFLLKMKLNFNIRLPCSAKFSAIVLKEVNSFVIPSISQYKY